VVTTLTPDLVWYASDQADTYTLQYSTSLAFPPGPSTTTVAGLEDTCYALDRNLGDGKYYFWRVWPSNAAGDGLPSGAGLFLVDVGVFLAEEEQRLTDDAGEDSEASLLQTSGGLWLAWCTDRDGNYEIYSKTSADGGTTWSQEECVSQDSHKDTAPCLAEGDGGEVWLVWSSRRPGGGNEIYCSVFDGAAWSAKVRLTDDPAADIDPCVARGADGSVWVAWCSDRAGGDPEIYCRTFDGAQWSAAGRLTESPGADLEPALLDMGDGTLWLVWSSDRGGHLEIYHKVFDGASWSADLKLAATDKDAGCPTIVRAWDGQVWLAYAKDVGIFYRMRVSGLWSDEAMLHSEGFADHCPSLAQAQDGRIWLASTSTRDGNPDVYAQMTNGSVTTAVPPPGGGRSTAGLALFDGRPNPFSRETLVKFSLSGEAAVDLAIYDVLGRRVRALSTGRLAGGEHWATWDGRNDYGARVPGGVYFCRLSTGGRGLARKLVLLQ